MPAIMLAVDLLFLSPPWALGSLPALGISGAIALLYWVWVEACYARNGWCVSRTKALPAQADLHRYPYPLFELLTPAYRVALFGGSAVVMTLSTSLLAYTYGRVNGARGGRPVRATARPGVVKQ